METKNPELDLSSEQWELLSVLDAFGTPVHRDVAGALSGLSPTEFLDLTRSEPIRQWIREIDPGVFVLTPSLPESIRRKLKEVNQSNRISELVDAMEGHCLTEQVPAQARARLFARAGHPCRAARIDYENALSALRSKSRDKAIESLTSAIDRLKNSLDGTDLEAGELFLSCVLLLSNIRFLRGKGLLDPLPLLEKALDLANRLGDRRSWALIELHLGRVFYFSADRQQALSALEGGLNEVKRLGDEDIQTQSSEFAGLYYYIQGLHREAAGHFESAHEAAESREGGNLINPWSTTFFGFSLMYLGQFHHAIGCLDCYWRLALDRSNPEMAANLQAVMGIALVLNRKNREAAYQLTQAEKRAIESKSEQALYLARLGRVYQYYFDARVQEAHELLIRTLKEQIAGSGFVFKFASPWFLGMLYVFEQRGFAPVPRFGFDDALEQALKEPNIHLRGVALRLRARITRLRNAAITEIERDLRAGEGLLIQSGDPLQLAEVRLEEARLCLDRGDRAKAQLLAKRARRGLSGDLEEFYPDDLRYLLESDGSPSGLEMGKGFLQPLQLLESMEELFFNPNPEKVFGRLVRATNRLFRAERGGLFRSGNSDSGRIELEAGCNMIPPDIETSAFRVRLDLIRRSLKDQRPSVTLLQDSSGWPERPQAVLMIPLQIKGRGPYLLYHDNAYFPECFNAIDKEYLKAFSAELNRLLDGVLAFTQVYEQRNRLVLEKSVAMQQLTSKELLATSPAMLSILEQADRAAPSDASVMVLGETGVGKELLARRIHELSSRRSEPFVVIDSGAISESLAESELFGHEKGAFTGADRRKQGRLELAHNGTLFIDEIGELSLNLQVKLLRVLQEQTFNRIGGNRTLHSDFRLIVATNRDLVSDVRAGRFRQDLFYRIHVISMTIPPLRDRPEDVCLLARHFVSFYAKKYHKTGLALRPEDYRKLADYHWPGNVRELKNVLERSVILSSTESLELDLSLNAGASPVGPFADRPSLDELQGRYIRHVIQETGGKIGGLGGAAEWLQINRSTLYSRMKKLGIPFQRGLA